MDYKDEVKNILGYIRKSYKKLKGSIYLDKTQLPLVHKIVNFESENIEDKLEELAKKLLDNYDNWKIYEEKLINNIGVLIYPKSIKDERKKELITNYELDELSLGKPQYFIDLDVEAHLLSMFWVLLIGKYLDSEKISQCAYGNRLLEFKDKNNFNNSPYVFKTYFSQYSLWRDKAMKFAKESLNNKEDIFILMLDFKSFYYSLDINKEWFDGIVTKECEKFIRNNYDIDLKIIQKIHSFIYKVLAKYSEKTRAINNNINYIKSIEKIKLDKRVFLPIGFFPSNIIANYYLKNFDDAILTKSKPIYYGRYVDDVIIVDKISHNIAVKNIVGNLSEKIDVMKILGSDIVTSQKGGKSDENAFKINNKIFNCEGNPDLYFQSKKFQLFCLNHKIPFTILDSFVKQIEKNTSEFRFLPDLDEMINRNDYSEIYNLKYQDTPNKFKFASNIALDKFSLSKFLGKYRKVGNLINDTKEVKLLEDLINILDRKTLVENYLLWERLLEITVVDGFFDKYQLLVNKIIESIKKYNDDNNLIPENNNGLEYVLKSAIYRTLALCRGKVVDDLITSFNKTYNLGLEKNELDSYCSSRMVNNYILPLPIDCFLDIDFNETCKNKELINLTNFNVAFNLIVNNKDSDNKYSYYPYVVRPQDIAFAKLCLDISRGSISPTEEQYEYICEVYKNKNGFGNSDFENKIKVKQLGQFDIIDINSTRKETFKIAIANVKLDEENTIKALVGKPNREVKRYEQLSQVVNIALKEKADMILFPECYLPLEWLPDITRLCANNQIAMITGIEHVVAPKSTKDNKQNVYNLTCIILPYEDEEYKYSYLGFHHKRHYSPYEKEIIKGYELDFLENSGNYKLFHWKDLWFPVYCCFELASIKDRAIFASIADFVVAVEWNKDTNYFNNIIESMARDLHCYCAQVNSSDYGESRIVQPTKSEKVDIVRTKGGINSIAFIGEIDVKKLRDFQRKKYNLQKEDKLFKSTPPDFDYECLKAKQNNDLFNLLKNKNESKD